MTRMLLRKYFGTVFGAVHGDATAVHTHKLIGFFDDADLATQNNQSSTFPTRISLYNKSTHQPRGDLHPADGVSLRLPGTLRRVVQGRLTRPIM